MGCLTFIGQVHKPSLDLDKEGNIIAKFTVSSDSDEIDLAQFKQAMKFNCQIEIGWNDPQASYIDRLTGEITRPSNGNGHSPENGDSPKWYGRRRKLDGSIIEGREACPNPECGRRAPKLGESHSCTAIRTDTTVETEQEILF